MYTTSFAFFEAIADAGVSHCFVNLGSDHPSIIEAMVVLKSNPKFPRIITCPSEVCVLPFSGLILRVLLVHEVLERTVLKAKT